MAPNNRFIAPADIMPMDEYGASRKERRLAISQQKKVRRVEVGPFATFHFENFDTMWAQVHEMLFIEGGGDDQLADELAAYNPLIPQGAELIATFMLEIPDASRRDRELRRLGEIETGISLDIGGNVVVAVPVEPDDVRITPDGKTSAIHFIRFLFRLDQVAAFKAENARVVLSIDHPNYAHMAVLPDAAREALAKDFD